MKIATLALAFLMATAAWGGTSVQITTGASAPTTSTTGDQYYDTSTTPVPTLLVAPAANEWMPSYGALFNNNVIFIATWRATTASSFNFGGLATSGTLTSGDGTDISAVKATTAATTAAQAWESSSSQVLWTAWNPDTVLVFATNASTLAASRYWAALNTAAGTIAASATPTQALIGFRYDTVADGTVFWRFCSNSGGDGVLNCLTSTVAVAVNTVYTGRIKVVGATSADGWINGTYIGRLTSDLPANNGALGVSCSVTTLENVAKAIRIHCMQGYSK